METLVSECSSSPEVDHEQGEVAQEALADALLSEVQIQSAEAGRLGRRRRGR